MHAAGWYPADPITFATSVRIVVDSVVRKPDDEAPVEHEPESDAGDLEPAEEQDADAGETVDA